jgi:sugar/nucleoside kinase (ribokinase family)
VVRNAAVCEEGYLLVDAEGAGDTFTSAFVNAMADGETVADAAHEAMTMASRSVGFLGSKGMFQR